MHRLYSSLYPPSALVAIGGPTLALVFDRSRKQQFRCGKCGTVFSRHTVRTRIFQLLWVWFFVSVGVILVSLFIALALR